MNHQRHLLLNAISKKRAQSGRLQNNVPDNVSLWEKVRHLDENAARQVARQIVDFALTHEAKVIVFEYLRRYKAPKEKMSRSGRKNHKRVYWLRGQIVQWVRDLAFREGILTVERSDEPWGKAKMRRLGTQCCDLFRDVIAVIVLDKAVKY